MNYRMLICLVVLIFTPTANIFSQVPTLDPLQTVNPATGDMSFSLPLATVQGNKGNDAQIYLNYQAGIQYRQSASNIGIGFSSAPGVITRQVVITPDDNERNYLTTCTTDDTAPWWVYVVYGVLFVLTVILAVLTHNHTIIAPVSIALGGVLSAGSLGVSTIVYGSSDYRAGGSHVETLTTKNEDRPSGLMHERTGTDLPDIFRIATPYVNGEMYYDCNENRIKMRNSHENYHFCKPIYTIFLRNAFIISMDNPVYSAIFSSVSLFLIIFMAISSFLSFFPFAFPSVLPSSLAVSSEFLRSR
jgi:hypothetical protein